MRPIAADAFAHGAHKGLERPRSDTGFRVRCNIRSVNYPERCFNSIPARECFSTRMRMTRRTMSDRGESFSTSNRFGSETLPGCGVHGGNRVPPGQNQNTDSSDENHYDYCDPKASNHCSFTLLHKCRRIRLLTR